MLIALKIVAVIALLVIVCFLGLWANHAFMQWLEKKAPARVPYREPLKMAMIAKDPELYEQIAHFPVMRACEEWRKVYPEDLQGVKGSDSAARVFYSPELIRPKRAPALS